MSLSSLQQGHRPLTEAERAAHTQGDEREVTGPTATVDPATEKELARIWNDPSGFVGWFSSIQNDALGSRIMGTAFLFFLVGGVAALLMRVQLAWPQANIISADRYNELFTMHGSTMMYLFAVPMLEGFAILLLPFMLGNREMPFPRLGAFSLYTFFLGGLLFYASYLFNAVPDAGWFAYVPLSGPRYSPGIDLDFWLLALGVAEIGAIAAGVEIIVAIVRMRAPGMGIGRIPLFGWAYLITAASILFAFTTLFVISAMLEMDRKFGFQFFNPEVGGSPLLWQHLFWVFGHPEVYIQFIPATGMISMIIPVFARHRLIGYNYIVMALVATGFMSFALWAHHMFTVGMPQISMSFFSAASILIAIPAGIQIFAWIATIAAGRPVWKTPFLFALGFLVIFVLGGITGIMVGVVPFDWQVHDSYFVVAHFHYVLIGGVTFPIFAALYYWMPKWTGKMMSERLGKWNFWTMFIGFNVAFFPMHIVGLLGMPRRYYTYLPGLGWDIYNLISTIGAFIFAFGVLLFLINLVYTVRRGEEAGPNPWGADSLEWASDSPPIAHGFTVLPIVRSRHPLWDQQDLFTGKERTVKLVEALGRWPTRWRAALTSSMVDAKPTEIFRVATPSIWPFFTAVGVITIFASEIFSLRWLVLSGTVLTIVSLLGWHWPNPIETTEEELAFEREHGIAVHPNGSTAVARWGMYLMILILSVALATLLFSYFYLRLESDQWPPENIPLPNPFWPLLGLAAMGGAVALSRWAQAGIAQGRQGVLRAGLGLAFLCGAAAVGLLYYDFTLLPFNQSLHAYGSLHFGLAGFLLLVTVVGLGQNLATQVWAWRNRYSAREHVAVQVGTLYWYAIGIFWLIVIAFVWGAPYWI